MLVILKVIIGLIYISKYTYKYLHDGIRSQYTSSSMCCKHRSIFFLLACISPKTNLIWIIADIIPPECPQQISFKSEHLFKSIAYRMYRNYKLIFFFTIFWFPHACFSCMGSESWCKVTWNTPKLLWETTTGHPSHCIIDLWGRT